ncbi:lipid droplet-associated hydrolase [Cephus cinctus]|uniref:Lipid droplet-associated hydrolase n=1 Tax=Cephus cinctus TaxID=211228 RepID=A0AAJ7FFF1_CEPCN|nr:lipid droplet-associated hydrolase [Cephus cinctus]XP_015589160.1 lipid droplet-associated hydrolase [Cephus cinctus]XP_024937904.1 lipid droplet-associated hydrolase [Cephus cinctus]
MQQSMLLCNGVQTHIVTEGRWVEEGLAPDGRKDIVIVIPGNPGVPAFYEGFIKSLKTKLPTETPVWIVGHAGHVLPPKHLQISIPDTSTGKHFYDLKGQLEHKAQFIKQYVPPDARIHLVGHSIGSWFTLNLLKDDTIASKVVRCYLLFPTVERMVESTNGKFYTGFVTRVAPLLIFLAWMFTFFPLILRVFLIRAFGTFYGIPSRSTKAVLQLVNPVVLRNVFMLANDEMRYVNELDHDVVSNHADKLWFYYGSKDQWTPIKYYEELREKHPNVQAILCKRGFYHSFVLSSDKEMGEMVGELINTTML